MRRALLWFGVTRENYSCWGADNQKVSAWPKKGYPKKGSALVLNQDTPRVIAVKRYTAEPYYLRICHNFSADWVARAEIQEVMLRASRRGFKRLRFKPCWGEWVADRLGNPLGEVTMPYARFRVSAKQGNLRVVEWSGAGAAFAVESEQFGICTQYLHPRHGRMVIQLGQYRKFGQYQGGVANLLGG